MSRDYLYTHVHVYASLSLARIMSFRTTRHLHEFDEDQKPATRLAILEKKGKSATLHHHQVNHHFVGTCCLFHVPCNPFLSRSLVLQGGAGYCSVLQCVAVRCSVLQCVVVCCSVLQCVTKWAIVRHCTIIKDITIWLVLAVFLTFLPILQRVAVCCSVLQSVVVCCSMLQCVAVCCSVPQT